MIWLASPWWMSVIYMIYALQEARNSSQCRHATPHVTSQDFIPGLKENRRWAKSMNTDTNSSYDPNLAWLLVPWRVKPFRGPFPVWLHPGLSLRCPPNQHPWCIGGNQLKTRALPMLPLQCLQCYMWPWTLCHMECHLSRSRVLCDLCRIGTLRELLLYYVVILLAAYTCTCS